MLFVLGGLPDLAVDPDVADDEGEEGDEARHDDLVVHAARQRGFSYKSSFGC